ncbi:hypothetical protein ACHAWF_001849 [Thalassiosira exigua]
MTNEMKRDSKHVMMATCNKAAGRNYMFSKFGKFINRAKVAYLAGRDDSSSGSMDNSLTTDISRMIENLRSSEEVSFTCLSDVPLSDIHLPRNFHRMDSENTITLCTNKDKDGVLTNVPVSDIPLVKDI